MKERGIIMSGSFQSKVSHWLAECFGQQSIGDKVERNHRFLEEALETVQANGCSREDSHRLVDYVFDRQSGDLHQEVGGTLTTLAALCVASGIDMENAGNQELHRIVANIDAIRSKRAAKREREISLRSSSPLP